MAVTAKFVADFSSFSAAVAKAEAELQSFEGDARKVGNALNRMTDAFSGRKLIQEAALMEKAIASAGGIATLTGNQLQQAGMKAAEAAEKMRKLGIEVPAGLQKIADGAKTSTTALSGLAVQIAGMFSVGAVIAFGRSVLMAGDQIQKMADQTGLSTEEVQKLQYVAGQSGTSIQSLVGAVQNLQQRLGDDNSGAAGAMKKLGINIDAFNKLGTYQQMLTLADAVRGVKDPTEQASLSAALFGKTWKEILPAIKSGMKETGDQATIMSDATVKAADRAGDALIRLQGTMIAWGGTAVMWLEKAAMAAGDYFTAFSPSHFGQTNSQLLAQQEAMAKADSATRRWASGAMAGIPPALALGEAAKDMGLSFSDATALAKTLDGQIEKSIDTNKKSAAATKLATDESTKAAKALRDFNNEIGVRFITDMGAAADATADAAAALRKFNNELGVQEIKDIEAADKATADLAKQMRALDNELGVLEMEQLAKDMAFVGPEMDILIRQTKTWSEDLSSLAGSMTQLAQVSGDSFGGIVKDLAQLVVAWDMATKSAEQYKAAQQSGSKMGMATGAVGMASSVWAATGTKSGMANVAGGAMTGAAIGTMIMPGLGTAVGAIAGAMVGLARSIHKVSEEEKDARKEVEKWTIAFGATLTSAQKLEAATAGWAGADLMVGVRDQFLAAGLSVDQAAAAVARLWDATREGPAAVAEAEAAIQAVVDSNTAAMDAIHGMGLYTTEELQAVADSAKAVFQFMERDGKYTAEQLAVAWDDFAKKQAIAMGEVSADTADSFTEAGKAIDELQAKYKTLSDSVAKEAPEKVMGSIEKAARAEMAVLKKQMDENRKSLDADAKHLKDSLEKALGDVDVKPIHIPIVWDVPRVPGGPSHEAPEPGDVPGFAGGTHGQYLNFGSGTAVTLHGRERVSTESEDTGAAFDWAPLLDSNERLMQAVKALPSAIQRGVRDGVARAAR